ncbi:MAG: hypothetical protein NC251_07755 [Lachnoclostridium sp.]|nr:hypothetical protein [Lachnospira sp.]MCM1248307.1 hypothetical protein [Lachnoclostridium sp.]
MVLIGVKENNGWLNSRWNLTYKIGWENILKACTFSSEYYQQFEILVDDQVVSVQSKEENMNLEEARTLTFRGISTIIKVPIMITLYNQLNAVDVSVAMATEEFLEADYEKFNKSLGQYLDSIELAMYR